MTSYTRWPLFWANNSCRSIDGKAVAQSCFRRGFKSGRFDQAKDKNAISHSGFPEKAPKLMGFRVLLMCACITITRPISTISPCTFEGMTFKGFLTSSSFMQTLTCNFLY